MAGRKPRAHLAVSMQYIVASAQAFSEGAGSLRDKFSSGSTARSPKEDVMKRNLIGLPLVVFSLLLTTTSAYSQSGAKAYVPFAFKAGQAQLPPGNYELKVKFDSDIVTIYNRETGKTALTLASVREDSPLHTRRQLVFHSYGNQHFLAEIWGSAGTQGIIFSTSKQERQMRQMQQVASSPSHTGKEVTIALK
jgi:hypothetical protein